MEGLETFCLLLEGFFVVNTFLLYLSPKEVRSKRFCSGHVKLEPMWNLGGHIVDL
jgi:hypothetical protein